MCVVVVVGGPTVGSRVAQNLRNVLVGGVLAQSAHDVGHLVVGHLVVTDSVKETKRLLEVWSGRKNQEEPFSSTHTHTHRWDWSENKDRRI